MLVDAGRKLGFCDLFGFLLVLRGDDTGINAGDGMIRFGESFTFYQDVPQILQNVRRLGILVGAASRMAAPDLARKMLKSLQLQLTNKRALDFFDYLQIYPVEMSSAQCADHLGPYLMKIELKTTHFTRLQKQTGLSYDEMLFFDDEVRNKNVEELGVIMYLIRNDVMRDVMNQSVKK